MIYIGVPVHNEERTAGVLLWRIRKLLSEGGPEFRVVVVDDGSTDETPEVLAPYDSVLPLTLIRHDERRGYAVSTERIVREVLSESDYHKRDALITLQADFTEAPEVIPRMVKSFQGGTDLVAAYPEEEEGTPRAVRWGRKGARFLLGGAPALEGVEDPFCGFRLYRLFLLHRAIQDLPDGRDRLLRHDGWAANAEMLAAVRPHVRQMQQVPFDKDYGRRYRATRFRLLSEMWDLWSLRREIGGASRGGGASSSGSAEAREAS